MIALVIFNKIYQKKNVKIEEVKTEDETDNSNVELNDIYNSWNYSLKQQFGNGTYGYNGWSNNDGWNSLSTMENYDAIEKILEQILKYKIGFSPEDVFREINNEVFEKTRYTEQAKKIYEYKFKTSFVDKNKVEVVNNTIRLK